MRQILNLPGRGQIRSISSYQRSRYPLKPNRTSHSKPTHIKRTSLSKKGIRPKPYQRRGIIGAGPPRLTYIVFGAAIGAVLGIVLGSVQFNRIISSFEAIPDGVVGGVVEGTLLLELLTISGILGLGFIGYLLGVRREKKN